MWNKTLYDNEKGSVLLVALIMLALLSLIGVAATRTTSTELQIAGNEKFQKIAFYTADAARGYVTMRPDLYGGDNITPGGKLTFPDTTDPNAIYTLDSPPNSQEFNGDVEYVKSSNPPRGSGFEAGKFHAHVYKMTCNGYGPNDSEKNLETGFYRIGF